MEDIEAASAPDTNKDKMVNGDMLQVSLGFSNAYGGTYTEYCMAWGCPSPCLPIQKVHVRLLLVLFLKTAILVINIQIFKRDVCR